MPKVRQRDPNDKIKTKSKKRSGGRKKKSNASRQIQAAVEQKVKQRKENEASNEYATSTTEQTVVDNVAGAAELTGRAADAVYDKVIRQQSPAPSASPGTEANSPENDVPQEPTIPANAEHRQAPQYTEQGRKLSVQQYADSHYGQNISPAPVLEPVHTDRNVSAGVQPEGGPSIGTGTINLPKSRDLSRSEAGISAVDMGRKYAVQSHINAQVQSQTAQQQMQLLPENRQTAQPHSNGKMIPDTEIKPKTRPVSDSISRLTPKTKDTPKQAPIDSAVEQGAQTCDSELCQGSV